MTRLYRSESDRILGGVCGGIAEVYDLDPSLIRLATALLFLSGAPLVLYLIAWIVIPSESEIQKDIPEPEGEEVELEDEV
jgi:phage shock protein C